MNNTLSISSEDRQAEELVREIVDEETVNDFRELAAELQLSEEQAQGVWEWIVDGAVRFVGELNQNAADYCAETESQLRGLFGHEFEARKKAANALVQKYGGDELVSFLKRSGIGNCREIVSFLMKLADISAEDRGLIGEKASALSGEERIKAEIARLMAVPAYMQARHPEHDMTVQQVYRLRKRLFGEE